MRSKRFSTLRLAAMVLTPFKLRCCDIILFSREMSRHIKPASRFFNFRSPVPRVPDAPLELITEHHVRPRRDDLVINVKATGE